MIIDGKTSFFIENLYTKNINYKTINDYKKKIEESSTNEKIFVFFLKKKENSNRSLVYV